MAAKVGFSVCVCVLAVSWWFCLFQQLTVPISCLLLKVFWWNHLLCFCRSRLQFQEKMTQLTSLHSALNHRHSNLFFICLFLFSKSRHKNKSEKSGSHGFRSGWILFLFVRNVWRQKLWFIVKQSPDHQTEKHVAVVVVVSFQHSHQLTLLCHVLNASIRQRCDKIMKCSDEQ